MIYVGESFPFDSLMFGSENQLYKQGKPIISPAKNALYADNRGGAGDPRYCIE